MARTSRSTQSDTTRGPAKAAPRATTLSPQHIEELGTQFDANLVRRFVQLLGIYPPGNLVKLSSGEVAVVTQVHAPDPHRPRVALAGRGAGGRGSSP